MKISKHVLSFFEIAACIKNAKMRLFVIAQFRKFSHDQQLKKINTERILSLESFTTHFLRMNRKTASKNDT